MRSCVAACRTPRPSWNVDAGLRGLPGPAVRCLSPPKLLLDHDAINACPVPSDLTERYVGLTGGEVEGNEELLEKFEAKYLSIFGPSRDFLSAHTELVVLAKKRRYDLTALAGTGAPHPTVQRFEQRDSEQRASTTSDPRAKW